MTIIEPTWITIPQWSSATLIGFACKGLIRARQNSETMFIGYGTSSTGLGGRLNAYRNAKGTGKNHYAGQRIHEHRTTIEMQVAVLDWPPDEIRKYAKQLIDKHQPEWNVPLEHQRRR